MLSRDVTDPGDLDAFVINLRRDPEHGPVVSSVELVLPEIRNRYSFKPRRRLEDLFSPELATQLEDAVGALKPQDRIVSLPDFEFGAPGLVLSGMRLLVTVSDEGTETIMMRVRQYIGSIKSVFRFDPAMAITSTTAREKIAVDVLQDIISPLFDLMALDIPGMDEVIEKHAPAIRKRLAGLNAKQEELVFFTGLLQRYVAGCKMDSERETALAGRKQTPAITSDVYPSKSA